MPVDTIRRAVSLVLLSISALLLARSLWPLPVQTRRLPVSQIELQPASNLEGAQAVSQGADRVLRLEWPSVVRTGEVFAVQMALLPVGAGEDESGQQTVDSPPVDPVLAEARLELPGVETSPPGETSQALPAGRAVQLTWRGRVDHAGTYTGTLWLHLRFLPGAERKLLRAPRIEIRARSFLGLTGLWARGLGSAGVVMGAVFGLDAAAAALWKRIFQKKVG
jgi:hypothetical protein